MKLRSVIAGLVQHEDLNFLLTNRIPRRPLRLALWVWLMILGGQFLFNSFEVWAAAH